MGRLAVYMGMRVIFLFLLAGAFSLKAESYDPLALPSGKRATIDLNVIDEERSRKIPLRLYLPPDPGPSPILLFSHGLGGSKEGSSFLGDHWAARGYVTVFLQHPGSDESVWKGKGLEGIKELKKAANADNFMLRARDIPVVLDQLQVWNNADGHPLKGRLDLARVGMSGHSFGAVTTQAVSGQKGAGGLSLTDSRIKAAIAFSPSVPARGNPADAFGSVKIPWMLMTGTKDSSAIGGATPESRQQVYPALPPGGKYELVLFGAEHSVFTDGRFSGENNQRNPNHHRVILALSTAFWDTWLKGDDQARVWLEKQGPASVLEAKDHWQHK